MVPSNRLVKKLVNLKYCLHTISYGKKLGELIPSRENIGGLSISTKEIKVKQKVGR